MSTTSRPIKVSVSGMQPVQTPAQGRPVHLITNGYTLRTLVPNDADARMLAWLSDPQMLRGLNLPPLNFDLLQLRQFIAAFDNLGHHFIGLFEGAPEGRVVGFYTIDVSPVHKLAHITTGVGERTGKNVLWATIDALIDHFFAERDIEKFSARILANNYRMLFNFKDNPRFALEARLSRECLLPGGGRVDVIVFGAHKGDMVPVKLGMAEVTPVFRKDSP